MLSTILSLVLLGAAAPPAPNPVKLIFSWPESATIQLALIQSVAKEGAAPIKSTSRYQLDVARGDQDWLIHWDTDTWNNVPFGLLPVDYRVDGQGVFLDVADLESYLGRLVSHMGAVSPHDRVLLGDAARRGAREDWNVLVGDWAGLSLEVGHTIDTDVTMDLGGTHPVRMHQHRLLQRTLACDPGGRALDCVELVLREEPFQEDLGLLAPGEKVTSVRNEVTLVTEIATLLPHHLLRKQTTVIERSGRAVTDEKITDWTYTSGAWVESGRKH